MANIPLTKALRAEYVRLFDTCRIRAGRAAEVERLVDQLASHRARYAAVEQRLGAPWAVVAVIHNMEAGQDFSRHLHNGDPLTARTMQVPAGRPRTGSPPFTWEESAIDSLRLKGLGAATGWTLAGTLYQLERYNGFGYRLHHPATLSPYLWGYSDHYAQGKYVADGRWSAKAVSRQCGAAVLLHRMAERGLIGFSDRPLQTKPEPARIAVPASITEPLVSHFALTRPADAAERERAQALQAWLSTFPGVSLETDGIAGIRTSDAYRRVTGRRLPGDPRGD
ncbi:MAG: hypothetical protein J7521_17470 [Caulobacter sp.]|nr:hypothetical protein [Caulobacter sp.]